MAATLHTEKFIVEVQYGGSRKSFDDLFKPRHIKSLDTKSVEHDVQKVSTKSIRSVDEQAIREVLRQAVTKAGYDVGNVAKGKLDGINARVDYAPSTYCHYNRVLEDLRENKKRYRSGKRKCEGHQFSIYLPHIYIAVDFDEPNLEFLAGWYSDRAYGAKKSDRKYTDGKCIYKIRQSKVKWDLGKPVKDENGEDVMEYFWGDDWRRKTYASSKRICLSDPNAVEQIAQYVIDLSPNKIEAFLTEVKADAEREMKEYERLNPDG